MYICSNTSPSLISLMNVYADRLMCIKDYVYTYTQTYIHIRTRYVHVQGIHTRRHTYKMMHMRTKIHTCTCIPCIHTRRQKHTIIHTRTIILTYIHPHAHNRGHLHTGTHPHTHNTHIYLHLRGPVRFPPKPHASSLLSPSLSSHPLSPSRIS
jgi:hypothetical protein